MASQRPGRLRRLQVGHFVPGPVQGAGSAQVDGRAQFAFARQTKQTSTAVSQLQSQPTCFAGQQTFVVRGVAVAPGLRGHRLNQTHDFHILRGCAIGLHITHRFDLGPGAVAQQSRMPKAQLQHHGAIAQDGGQAVHHDIGVRCVGGWLGGLIARVVVSIRRLGIAKQIEPLADLGLCSLSLTVLRCPFLLSLHTGQFGEGIGQRSGCWRDGCR